MKRPGRELRASVNAPFTCPNSSLSSRLSGIAAQLMATNGPSLRGLRWWMALATSSLPVPLSPVMSTVVSVSATRATRSYIFFIALLVPRMSSNRCWSTTTRRRRFTSSRSARCLRARSMVRAMSSISNGFVTKSYAPARMVAMAASMLPKAVITTTGRSSRLSTICRQTSTPVIPCMLMSVSTRPKSSSTRRRRPSSGEVVVVVSNPRFWSSASSTSHMLRSSSMMRIRRSTVG